MIGPRRPRSETVEVLSIGNELLIGQTLDTNSNWIAKQVTRHGWTLNRVSQIRDSIPSISHAIKEILERAPSLLITIGGLGPTHDDMTLKGVSKAIGRAMRLNIIALGMIRRHYIEIEGPRTLTRQRKKMAVLPDGALPLPNPIGTAPGSMVSSGRTLVISLPGVPAEMRAIFEDSIVSLLKNPGLQAPREIYISLIGIIESALAPVLMRAQRNFPGLYFKSHPRGNETTSRSLIHIHVYSLNQESEKKLPAGVALLVKLLSHLTV